jgi:hypothetical protein
VLAASRPSRLRGAAKAAALTRLRAAL